MSLLILRQFWVILMNLWKILRVILRPNSTNILGLVLLLLVLFWLFEPLPSRADDVADPTQAIAAIENLVKPTLQKAVDWSYSVGIRIVGTYAFYALVIRLIRVGD